MVVGFKRYLRKEQRAKQKFERVMQEFADGTLFASDGTLVTDRKQALAIAYSVAGLSKKRTRHAPVRRVLGKAEVR